MAVSRVAWFIQTGSWPPPEADIDHVNGVRDDNRWLNLRLCAHAENIRAQRVKPGRFKGVYRMRKRWQAKIMLNRKSICLGTFDTPEEAALVYDTAARRYFGDFAATNFASRETHHSQSC